MEDGGVPGPVSVHKETTTLEISMISANGYKSRHSQPECGYALEPSQWTEYSIHSMDPYNLELTFEFFEVTLGGLSINLDSMSVLDQHIRHREIRSVCLLLIGGFTRSPAVFHRRT